MPHFIDSRSGSAIGFDQRSTIDSAWLLVGGLWAAEFLRNPRLEKLAKALFHRVDWPFWTATTSPNIGLIHHGADIRGRRLPSCWDRVNGETIFLYVLAAGAEPARAWPVLGFTQLNTAERELAGLRFGSADLGLFVFQYGLDLFDAQRWPIPGHAHLATDASLATQAQLLFCEQLRRHFATYEQHWGISAGDGPNYAGGNDVYRCYSPSEPLDGTAHLMASLASIAHAPAQVCDNLHRAASNRNHSCRGRYGFGNINLDRVWSGSDIVGIDAGAALLALDNYLENNRIRRIFEAIEPVQLGLQRLRFTKVTPLDRRAAA